MFEPEDSPKETRHEPIITKELFDSVQAKLSLRSKPIQAKRFYKYSRIITCGKCGGTIQGTQIKGYVYYRCGSCRGESYTREEYLDDEVVKLIDKADINQELFDVAINEIKRQNEVQVSQRVAVVNNKKKTINSMLEKA